ncbi:MAG: hypothetical protein KGJ31_02425 [Patescibacteria group bacterium]|nr:hypothetical protein [Patescibacteria group bacterium]
MKNNFENLIRKAGAPVALTKTEREKMRLLLREYAAMKPVRKSIAPAGRAIFPDAWLAYFGRPAVLALAALLILTLSSGGLVYAAQGTLPGDALYPLKVDVIEPLRVTLAVSPEAKASLQMTFAEHRIDEAAQLARNGRLNTATEAALAANFTKNADGAGLAVAQDYAHGQTSADLLTMNFAARLAAYESVLALLQKQPGNARATAHLQTAIQSQIASIVSTQENEQARATSSQETASQEPAVTSQDVLHLQNAADNALRVSADIIGTASSSLDASSSADARSELMRASALVEHGRALLEQHDESGASRAFQDSLSATARLDVLTRAASTLKIQAFSAASESSTTSSAETGPSTSSDGSDPSSLMPSVSPSVPKDRGFQLGL